MGTAHPIPRHVVSGIAYNLDTTAQDSFFECPGKKNLIYQLAVLAEIVFVNRQAGVLPTGGRSPNRDLAVDPTARNGIAAPHDRLTGTQGSKDPDAQVNRGTWKSSFGIL